MEQGETDWSPAVSSVGVHPVHRSSPPGRLRRVPAPRRRRRLGVAPTSATSAGSSEAAWRSTSARNRSSRPLPRLCARVLAAVIATSGATKTALNRMSRAICVGRGLPELTIAAITAKYGNAVGSSTAMIAAPRISGERATRRSSFRMRRRTRARWCHSPSATRRITVPKLSSMTAVACLPGRGRAVRIACPGPNVRTRPPSTDTPNTPAVKTPTP